MRPGKRVGPNHEWSSTWILATSCFLLSPPIQMTLHLPTILHTTIKIFIAFMDTASYAGKYIKHDFPLKLMTWLSYPFIPAIGSMLSSCSLLFCGLPLIPIYSWKLLFHPDGRSILDILQNPEGHG
jgi:hypothetical protein